MSVTVIFSDAGDADCSCLPLMWKDLPDVKVLQLTDHSNYTKDDILKAIEAEDDTLIMCGHGTPSGLLGYAAYPETVQKYKYYGYDSRRFANGEKDRKTGGKTSIYDAYAALFGDDDTWEGAIGEMVDKDEAEDADVNDMVDANVALVNAYATLFGNDDKREGANGEMVDKDEGKDEDVNDTVDAKAALASAGAKDSPEEQPEDEEDETVQYMSHRFGTVIERKDADKIHAKRVIAVWCHASDYAVATHLYGFWSSMFISNSMEARYCGFPGVPNEIIMAETKKFCRDLNVLIKNDVPQSEWVEKIIEVGNMNYKTTEYNYRGLRYFPK